MKGGNFLWLILLGVGLLLLSGGGGVIGAAPPFKTDKLSVLIIEETKDRTTQLENIYSAVEKATKAAGGNFQKLDQNNSDQSMNDDWVKEAFKLKGASVPWVVAATAKTGINQALPTTSDADAIKLLSPLGVK